MEKARELSIAAGGLPLLRNTYSWHPSFQDGDEGNTDNQIGIDFQSFMEKGALANKTTVISSSSAGDGEGAAASANSQHDGEGGEQTKESKAMHTIGKNQGSDMSAVVSQSLGDPKWLAASQKAEATLESVRLSSERDVDDIITKAFNSAKEQGGNFIDVLLESVNVDVKKVKEIPVGTVGRLSKKKSVQRRTTVHDDIEMPDDDDEPMNDLLRQPTTPLIIPSSFVASHTGDAGVAKGPAKKSEVEQQSYLAVADDMVKEESPASPEEGFSQLPIYLRGGQEVAGFGVLLGNALSLLLTARHGLKESKAGYR